MGFIKAIPEDLCGDIDIIWDNFIYGSGAEFAERKGAVSNGSRIAVKQGQALLLLCEGKIADYADEPGGYIYHSGVESFFSGISDETNRLKVENPVFFTDCLTEDAELYFLNIENGIFADFRFDNITIYDEKYDLDITLSGSGSFGIKPDNPLDFYIRFVMQGKNADYSSFSKAFEEQLESAIDEVGTYGAGFDELIYAADILSEIMAEKLSGNPVFDGAKPGEIFFSSIMPDGSSLIKVTEKKRSIAETKQRKAAVTAIAFLLGKIAENKAAEEIRNDVWICPQCGAETFGNFCSVCGGKRPEKTPERLFCTECGCELTGKKGILFCPQCGTKIVR